MITEGMTHELMRLMKSIAASLEKIVVELQKQNRKGNKTLEG
ncbi:MAG: hypothetical protein ACTSYJ_00490 [Candidatus Thorarchaeota archaeon]